jgi:hypothetical protein
MHVIEFLDKTIKYDKNFLEVLYIQYTGSTLFCKWNYGIVILFRTCIGIYLESTIQTTACRQICEEGRRLAEQLVKCITCWLQSFHPPPPFLHDMSDTAVFLSLRHQQSGMEDWIHEDWIRSPSDASQRRACPVASPPHYLLLRLFFYPQAADAGRIPCRVKDPCLLPLFHFFLHPLAPGPARPL